MSGDKSGSKTNRTGGKDPLPLLTIAIVAVALGIIAVSWFFIETLQDNSTKLRKYKVQPDSFVMSNDIELKYVGDSVNETDNMLTQHVKSVRLSRNAHVLMEQKQYAKAIDFFKKSILEYELDVKAGKRSAHDGRNLAEEHEEIAHCYSLLGDFPSSLKHCTAAIVCDPKFPQLYVDRAYVNSHLGNKAQAKADAEMAKTLGVDSPLTGQDVLCDFGKANLGIGRRSK